MHPLWGEPLTDLLNSCLVRTRKHWLDENASLSDRETVWANDIRQTDLMVQILPAGRANIQITVCAKDRKSSATEVFRAKRWGRNDWRLQDDSLDLNSK